VHCCLKLTETGVFYSQKEFNLPLVTTQPKLTLADKHSQDRTWSPQISRDRRAPIRNWDISFALVGTTLLLSIALLITPHRRRSTESPADCQSTSSHSLMRLKSVSQQPSEFITN